VGAPGAWHPLRPLDRGHPGGAVSPGALIPLWHFTALTLAAAVLLPLGVVPVYPDGSGPWWLVRLATVIVLTPVLVALAAVVGRFERSGGATAGWRLVAAGAPAPRLAGPPVVGPPVAAAGARATGRLLVAVACLSAGFALVAVRGLSEPAVPLGVPVAALVPVGAGALLVRRG
jgi:hypothetical protein